MARAIEIAMYLMKLGIDDKPNTYDGNMKLQKILCFANLISLSELGRTLFDDDVYAFENGLVVENVRLFYKNDYQTLKKDSLIFSPNFTDNEYRVIKIACDVFGDATARELSELTHSFSFWEQGYKRSIKGQYREKEKSIVSTEEMAKELERIHIIAEAYSHNQTDSNREELVNGVKFYITQDIALDDDLYSTLYDFSLDADEISYTVCRDEEGLVIY